jgi:Holliday junction resolvasome RuvABC endonuclease subunit
MSTLDFSGLGDLAKGTVKTTKTGWQPLTLDDLGLGRVLFFDQSLTAAGWVTVVRDEAGIWVTGAGTIRGKHEDLKRGMERDLRRSVDVFERAYVLISDAVSRRFSVAHESPPPTSVVGAGASSAQAAVAVRCAAALAQTPIEMLGAQPAKTLVCGNSKADKQEAHAALKVHCFPWIQGVEAVTNEATRDALMGALLWLRRRR